jgi:hypothetical protein
MGGAKILGMANNLAGTNNLFGVKWIVCFKFARNPSHLERNYA